VSEPENFIARWLRVKQESSVAAARPPEADMPSSDPAPAPFDPACLPPIESITKESDISAFMQPDVPAELMRAALRTAWRADPAIRDFIGIAESQWDFNDPTAMPGFGPLLATDNAQSLASQFSRVASASDAIGAGLDFPTQPAETLNEPRDRHADKVWRSSGIAEANPLKVEKTCRAPEERRVDSEIRPEGPRRHGSALPKAV
jgi:hypothetical protein